MVPANTDKQNSGEIIEKVHRFLDEHYPSVQVVEQQSGVDAGAAMSQNATVTGLVRAIVDGDQGKQKKRLSNFKEFLLKAGRADTQEEADNIAQEVVNLLTKRLDPGALKKINRKAEDAITRLNQSDFYQDLEAPNGFKDINLDERTINRGHTLLAALFNRLDEQGVEGFIRWVIHPTIGFLPQDNKVRPYPKEIAGAVTGATSKCRGEEAKAKGARRDKMEKAIPEKPESDSPSENLSVLETLFTRVGKVGKLYEGEVVVDEFAMTQAASNLLEHYLYPEKFQDQSAVRHYRSDESSTFMQR